MEKFVVKESHGKIKISRVMESEIFYLIRIQNITRDTVVSKLGLWWISREKFARIPNAEMVRKIANFTLIFIQNIVMDIVVTKIVQ